MNDAARGRDAERSTVHRFLDGCTERSSALVIVGEPGIGKTTLVRWALRLARERGFRVVAAFPVESEARLAYAGLRDLCDALFDEFGVDLPQPQRAALAIALLRTEPDMRPPSAAAVAAATLGLVRLGAAAGPLLVAVDDVPWLDEPSAAVLAFVARRMPASSFGLLLTARTSEADGSHRLNAIVDEPRTVRLDLAPLTLHDLHGILRDRLGLAVPRPTLRRLHGVSGGNPFFALEIGRLLQARGGDPASHDPLPVPGSLYELVAGRLDRLAPHVRLVLQLAAALPAPTISRLELAAPGASEALDLAGRAGIVRLDGDAVRFSHPLLAAAAWHDATRSRRRAAHAQLADSATTAEERARHRALATAAPDEAVAAEIEAVAERLGRRGAPSDAADLLAHARRLTPPGREDDGHRRALREARFAILTGDTTRARALAEHVLSASPVRSMRVHALLLLAWMHLNGVDWAAGVGFARRALAEAGDEPELRAPAEVRLAEILDLIEDDVAEVLDHARNAATFARELGESSIEAQALGIQAKAIVLAGRGLARDLVARALSLDDPAELSIIERPRDYVAVALGLTDAIEQALDAYEAIRHEAAVDGDEAGVVWTLVRMAYLEVLTGDWAAASRHLGEAQEVTLQTGQVANDATLEALRALLAAHRGEADATRDLARRSLDVASQLRATTALTTALWSLGLLELSQGHPDRAADVLGSLVAERRAAGIGEPSAMRFATDHVEACLATGRIDEAAELLDWFEAASRRLGRMSTLATALRCRGLLLASGGHVAAALRAFDEALAAHAARPLPFERARTLLALGQTQRRAKQRAAARRSLDEALRIFEDLGARAFADRTRDESARISGRRSALADLTESERQVAALVANGLTNREVAARLYITEKTVEFHLRNIFGKLAIRSRAELIRDRSAKP